MKKLGKVLLLLIPMMVLALVSLPAADAKANTLTCVALYSETSEGAVSYHVGKGAWVVIKVGDVIPADAEIRINIDRDWITLTPSNDPTKAWTLLGSEKGDVLVKVPDVFKGKAKIVKFPKASKDTDPAFKDKLVVKQFVGRQVYRASPDSSEKDLEYGDILDIKGTVRIIGINNTLTLMFPNGAVTTVVGPLKFEVKKVFEGSSLYKYLNVAK
jgi:hypothetical protein